MIHIGVLNFEEKWKSYDRGKISYLRIVALLHSKTL